MASKVCGDIAFMGFVTITSNFQSSSYLLTNSIILRSQE